MDSLHKRYVALAPTNVQQTSVGRKHAISPFPSHRELAVLGPDTYWAHCAPGQAPQPLPPHIFAKGLRRDRSHLTELEAPDLCNVD